jgi:DNA-binding NarL/FixJ family response regulator
MTLKANPVVEDVRIGEQDLSAPERRTAMLAIRISVLSDDRLFRESVLRLLEDEPALLVSAEPDVNDLADIRCADFDVFILDARMTGVLRWCTRLAMEASSVILIGAPEDDDWAEEALRAGARGILTKTSAGEEVAKAIHVVTEGGIWARRRWLNASLKSFAASQSKPVPAMQLGARLSDREREVFYHAALGASNKELADRLGISEATVKAHLTHIFHKLGVTGRAELAAAYHGLLRSVPNPQGHVPSPWKTAASKRQSA